MANSLGPSFLFGGREFPLKTINKHVFFLGATGSGKTPSLQAVLQSIVTEIGRHHQDGGYRALLYDSKLEVLPWLWQLEDELGCRIIISNPFDARSSAWDVSRDVTSYAAAYAMAFILCPVSDSDANPFWGYACLIIVYSILKALNKRAPRNWDLRHVVLIARSIHHLRELFSQDSATRHLVGRYLQDGKLCQSILATLETKLEPYAIIAALWSKAESQFSLREFVAGESILVLGNNEEARESIDAINRCIFKRLTGLLLAQCDSATRRTIIALDELREAGQLDGLRSLALRGRSKGAAIVAAAQDRDGLVEVYGENTADEILGQFGYKGVLRLDSPGTADWAASLFGATEVKEKHRQSSRTLGGDEVHFTQGMSETLRERDAILKNEIMYFHTTTAIDGLEGVYKTPYGSFRNDYDFVSALQCRSDGAQPPNNYGFIERDESDQVLDDWTDEELNRFGLTPVPLEDSAFPPRNRERPSRPRDRNPRRNRNQPRTDDVDRDQDVDDEDDDV